MPSENVEAAHRLVESVNRQDLDAVLALLDEDIEFVPRFSSLRGRGHDEIRAWWADVFAAVPDFRLEIVGVREYDDDTLVLHLRVAGRGSGSDTPFDESNWTAVRGRDGKCVWWSNHATEDEALKAAGLSPLSEENVEIVRRVFEATARGDTERVFGFYDPQVELDSSRAALGRLVGAQVYRGHEGVRRFYRAYYEAWDHIGYDIEELIDAGNRVVSIVTIRARGRASGAEVELRMSGVWTIKDGLIVRVVYFHTADDALEAAGLSE